MGNVFGLVLGSYEGITPPVPLPGQRELPKVPWRESVRDCNGVGSIGG